MAEIAQPSAPVVGEGPSTTLLTVAAVAIGALVANLYYAQPLISSIGPELKVSPAQIGYGMGLFFLVSLSDLVESRKLILTTLTITAVSLLGMAVSTAAAPFFLAAFLIGLCSTGAQVLLPLIVQMVPLERRGRVVGNVMAGLLTGIMLARPVSLFIAASFGWRAVFYASAVLMVLIGVALYRMLPEHRPKPGLHYGQILWSMIDIVRDMPAVRWAAASLYDYLLRGGVRIHEYCERPLHAKVAVIDGVWATVGSSNLDPLSLFLNLEANVVVEDEAFAGELKDKLDRLIASQCRELRAPHAGPSTLLRNAAGVMAFHTLRRLPRLAGWLPAHATGSLLRDAGEAAQETPAQELSQARLRHS